MSAYPSMMDLSLVKKLCHAALDRAAARSRASTSSPSGVAPSGFVKPEITFTAPLRGHTAANLVKQSVLDAEKALGGMRAPARAQAEVPGLRAIGKKLHPPLLHHLRSHPLVFKSCLSAIGSTADAPGPTEADLDIGRAVMGEVLGTQMRGCYGRGNKRQVILMICRRSGANRALLRGLLFQCRPGVPSRSRIRPPTSRWMISPCTTGTSRTTRALRASSASRTCWRSSAEASRLSLQPSTPSSR